MIEHTHTKSHYAVIIGCKVQFLARPALTKQKKYREPVIVERKRFRTKADAARAAQQWEGKLL